MNFPIAPPVSIDIMFLLATAAFGWGLSLATYRFFALRRGWPMGKVQAEAPAVPILIGLFGVVIAFLFAAARGAEYGGWWILVFGLLWAIFWTSLLRVASQVALFLAPAATFLLIFSWASGRALMSFGSLAGPSPAVLQPQPAATMGLPGAPRPRVVETLRVEEPARTAPEAQRPGASPPLAPLTPDMKRIEDLTRGMTTSPAPRGPVPQQ
jgi:hypothetical protein